MAFRGQSLRAVPSDGCSATPEGPKVLRRVAATNSRLNVSRHEPDVVGVGLHADSSSLLLSPSWRNRTTVCVCVFLNVIELGVCVCVCVGEGLGTLERVCSKFVLAAAVCPPFFLPLLPTCVCS